MSEPTTVTMNADLPSVEVPPPVCEHCGLEVEVKDYGWQCDHCRITWGTDAGHTPSPIVLARCGLVVETERPPWTSGDKVYTPGPSQPCILPENHGTRAGCLNPYDVVITDAEVSS